MTPIVDINTLAVQSLPPNKRFPTWIAQAQAMSSATDWNMQIWDLYKNGGVTDYYNALLTYSQHDLIIYNYQVWESLTNLNTGNTPNTSPNDWMLAIDSFIGVSESTLYIGRKLQLEFALNRYFQGELTANGFVGFKQPDSPFAYTPSDIYIDNVAPTAVSFVMYPDTSSFMFPTYSTGYLLEPPVYAATSTYQFNVNIPTAVFASINANSTIAEKIIRKFVDKYAIIGTFYNIVTY